MSMKTRNIREHLEKERQNLLEKLASISGKDVNEKRSSNSYSKQGEIAVAYSELERKYLDINNLNDQITEIEHALEKVHNGTYGFCDKCGCPIPHERLEVLPQTTLCIQCKIKQSRIPSRIGTP
jgi:DnaK suppressor protein